MFLARFCSKVLPKHEGFQKNQSFSAKCWRVPKKQKKQSFGVLSCSKTLCFFAFFWDPPAFWHQNFGFWDPSRLLAAVFAPKPLFLWGFLRAQTWFRRLSSSRNPVSDLTNSMERRLVGIRTASSNEIAQDRSFCSVFSSYMTTSVA